MYRNSLLGLLLCYGAAQADPYHYINTPVGDRASGMAGAYTAISDDASGLFYNPAGLVYGEGNSISSSINSYSKTLMVYENVLGGRYDWVRDSGTLLPNFFGVVQPLGKGRVGFSYAIPNASLENQDQVFYNVETSNGLAERYIINFNNEDNTYKVGPSYAIALNDSLSIGATLYFHHRSLERINNQVLFIADDPDQAGDQSDQFWLNTYIEVAEYGIDPMLGLMWIPMDKISLGATISKVEVFSNNKKDYATCLGLDRVDSGGNVGGLCEQNGVVKHSVFENEIESNYPWRVALGAAWFPSAKLLVSSDLIYHSSSDGLEGTREAVLNAALGVEYYLNQTWAVRGGFYTDYANTPELKNNITGYNQSPHIDLYGVSFSVSRFTRSSSLTFGCNYSAGYGQAQVVLGSADLQDVQMEALSIYMAASYAY